MGLLYYIIYRAFGSYHDVSAHFPILIVLLLQLFILYFIIFFLLPENYISLIKDTGPFNGILVVIIIYCLNYISYFREKASKKIIKKYTYQYKFIDDKPTLSVWLFIILPFIIILSVTFAIVK